VVGSCGHDNEPLGCIEGEEFLDKLSDCQLLKNDSAPWSWSVLVKGIQIMKFLILKLSPSSCYFLPLRSRNSP